MAEVSARLAVGRLSLAEWEREMRRQIRDAHATAHAMARGGWKRMTPSDWGRVGAAVREQYKYLSAFAAGIETGAVPRTKALAARARLYAEAARRSHFETERWLMANRGYVEERSVLGIADHCDGCLAEAGKGWRPIGTLLPIGGRDCKARCRCWFEYRKRDAFGQTSGDGDVEIVQRPDLEKLSEAEFVEAIRHEQVEVLGAFRDGKQIHVPHQGARNGVPLLDDFAYDGATVVHNHPDDKVPSSEDLITARKRRVLRLIVATPNRVFQVEPETTWPEKAFVLEAYVEAEALAQEATARDVSNLKDPPGDEWALERFRRRLRVTLARALRHIGVIMKFR